MRLIEARLHAAILRTIEQRFFTTIFACAHQNLAGHECQHDVSDGKRDREIWHYKCDADNNDRRDYMHVPLAGNAALFSRVLKMGAAAIRADNHPFRRSFFYWDWFSGSFSWSSSSIPPYKFIQHDCYAECPLSTRTPFPLCCFTLSANHSPTIKGKAQRSLLTLPRARAASNTCFALTQGKPKRRAFYTMSIRIPPAPLSICTASPSVTYLYS